MLLVACVVLLSNICLLQTFFDQEAFFMHFKQGPVDKTQVHSFQGCSYWVK